jgi:hypothetical protein
MRLRRVVLVGIAVTAPLAACSSSSPKTAGPSVTTAPSSSTTTTTTRPAVATGLRGKRYCEVLLVRLEHGNASADVYNTYPLNACPEAQWSRLSEKTIATNAHVPLAFLNGPRYWLMDEIEKTPSADQVRKTFGGITMIREANVEVGPIAAALLPYAIHEVDRSTVFTFDAGTTVYELHSPNGSTYVMQSWSQQIDPNLRQADLAGLGPRLHRLPAGWTYQSRKLTAPLRVVTTTAKAKVLQDDFKNSYSFERKG